MVSGAAQQVTPKKPTCQKKVEFITHGSQSGNRLHTLQGKLTVVGMHRLGQQVWRERERDPWTGDLVGSRALDKGVSMFMGDWLVYRQ